MVEVESISSEFIEVVLLWSVERGGLLQPVEMNKVDSSNKIKKNICFIVIVPPISLCLFTCIIAKVKPNSKKAKKVKKIS